jgi:hypothetical protein
MCWESAVDDGRGVWIALPINCGCQETTSVSVSLENRYEVVIRSSSHNACAAAAAPQSHQAEPRGGLTEVIYGFAALAR